MNLNDTNGIPLSAAALRTIADHIEALDKLDQEDLYPQEITLVNSEGDIQGYLHDDVGSFLFYPARGWES